MKNLQTTLEITTNGKWGQTSSRTMKKELETYFLELCHSLELDTYECEKGFNVELFDANGRAFIMNLNPTIRAFDYEVDIEQEIYLQEQERKAQDAKERKEKAEKKKAQDKLKREQAKSKR